MNRRLTDQTVFVSGGDFEGFLALIKEMSVSESLMRRRNGSGGVKTGGFQDARISAGGNLLTAWTAPGLEVT